MHIQWNAFEDVKLDFLLVALGLMPANWIIEASKWQFLLKDVQKIYFRTALKGVLVGITSGMATPNRIGEYVGRTFVLSKHNRVKGSLATMLGSLSQVLITLILGLIGWIILFEQVNFFQELTLRPLFMSALVGLMFIMLLLFYNLQWVKRMMQWFSINKKYVDEVSFLNRFRGFELTYVLFLSLLRYIIFTSQYIIILTAFGINIPIINSISAIFLIYLIIVFIPHFTISELGVRASVAILIFQVFTSDLQIVAWSAGILWMINLLIPTILGSYYLVFNKK
jgi:uncharacterized protein (TIRG00374 family)